LSKCNATLSAGSFEMKFVAATNNKHKLRELGEILEKLGHEVISLKEAGVSVDPEEIGATFAENAKIKADAAFAATRLPSIADDSGLVIDALNGEPGVYSARYGGDDCKSDEDRCALILQKMNGKNDRTAKFICSICVKFDDEDYIVCDGVCPGEINFAPKGSDGFGYDPIFYLPEFGKTMSEMTADEKNGISHRGNAVKKFAELLEKRN